MTLPRLSARALMLATAITTATASAGSFGMFAPDVAAGGGTINGGNFTAFTTIAATGPAVVMSGGGYEVTGGIERRRVYIAPPDEVFRDNFE